MATDDSLTTDEDTWLDFTVADLVANDSDADGDALADIVILTPTGGTVVWAGGDAYQFRPTDDLCGTAAGGFDYTVGDGQGGQDTGHVAVTIGCVDDAPVAHDDSFTVDEDADGSDLDVLGNDTDVEDDTFEVTSYTRADHGTVSDVDGTAITYEPHANYCGPDEFTYTIDGGDTATVEVTVDCLNDAPVASDDLRTMDEDTQLVLLVNGITSPLMNDTDADADTLTISGVSGAVGGTVDLSGAVITFTPTADRCDGYVARFDYTVTDGNGGTDTGRVNIWIDCLPDAPRAVDDSVTVDEDGGLALGLLDLDTNDTDPDGDTISITGFSGATGGTITSPLGYPVFRPNANLCGPDAAGFDYAISDGNGGTDTGHVSITITCIDDDPTAVDDTLTVAEHDEGGLDVLANDLDPDGDAEITSYTQPDDGSVDLDNGEFVYDQTDALTCGEGDTESDSFTYTLDGVSTATVSVTITCVNDAPVAIDDHETIPEDGTIAPVLWGIVDNDVDADGDTLSVTDVFNPTGGVLVITHGVTTFETEPNLCGVDVAGVDYTISDGHGGTDTGHMTFTLNCVQDAPVNRFPAGVSTREDTPFTFGGAYSISVTDVDGDDIRVTLSVTGGTFSLSGTTGLTFDTGDGVADTSATFSGSQADMNAALDGLVYTPPPGGVGYFGLDIETTGGSTDRVDIYAV